MDKGLWRVSPKSCGYLTAYAAPGSAISWHYWIVKKYRKSRSVCSALCASPLSSARGRPFGRSPVLRVVVAWVGRGTTLDRLVCPELPVEWTLEGPNAHLQRRHADADLARRTQTVCRAEHAQSLDSVRCNAHLRVTLGDNQCARLEPQLSATFLCA